MDRFSTLVIFGTADIADADLFGQVVRELIAVLGGRGPELKAYGAIYAARQKNVSPRSGKLSGNTISRWQESLSEGRFEYLSLFDSAWERGTRPAVYGSLHRFWDYGPGGYSGEVAVGARSCLTLSLDRELIPAAELELESKAESLAIMINAAYGFIEHEVPFVLEVLRHGDRFINMRWRDTWQIDYKSGRKYSMNSAVPRLYWGNILQTSHFRGNGPKSIPPRSVALCEHWTEDLVHLRFADDPEFNPILQDQLGDYFHLIPGAVTFATNPYDRMPVDYRLNPSP